MRVAPQQGRGRFQAHLAQHLENPGPGVTGGPARPGVDPERFPQLVADPQGGVQGGRRVLRHVADPGPAHLPQAGRAQPQQVRPVQADLAGADGQAAPGVPEQGEGDGRLP